ncbi:uncharacterized protein LOC121508068 [Cheilinus undulatus]|uniref:uncharacterized protein LOC121508068 n=1 Tax=Cheilinus undulatus TaxID=241271 RepID=UPI001BD621B2|nr:uncharacterized protein LOC121508068 [Cheilinus undulatus]XP_041640501.1 uncharacterized protein LOC121508068 [Cheilinus undulatus]
MDHSYAFHPVKVAKVDLALENKSLKAEVEHLKRLIEKLHMTERFGIQRFASSDKDIRFFTRFASYDLLMSFWAFIEPSLPFMTDVKQAQRDTFAEPITLEAHSLQPIDELFMFLNYLALGSKQCDLAHRFDVQLSTVSWIITTWSNFLYIVLGSVRIWMPEEEILEHLPAEFKDYENTTVILDCAKLRCQCPSSPLFQRAVSPTSKSQCTLKGLFGVAPHGAVTFISPLYAGSISNKQIIRESGILSLLRPGMAIMVNKGLLVDDNELKNIYRPSDFPNKSWTNASLRVLMTRLTQRVKDHKFFDSEIPPWLLGNINQLYSVACLLTNYENGPLLNAYRSKETK